MSAHSPSSSATQPPAPKSRRPRSRTTRGPRSRYLAGSRLVHMSGGSTTWSSTEMMRGTVTNAPCGSRGGLLGSCVGEDGLGLAAGPQDGARRLARRRAVDDHLDAVHEDVRDADRLGQEPWA